MTAAVLCEPYVVLTTGIPSSLTELRCIFSACNIASPESEREQFLLAVLRDTAPLGEFTYQVRFPSDLGYVDAEDLPTVQQCLEAANSQGLEQGSPALVFALLRRRVPPVLAGKACLAPMRAIVSGSGYSLLPQIQTIKRDKDRPQTMLRMVAGDSGVRISLRMPMLFFTRVR